MSVYTPTNWQNGPGGGTPLEMTALNNMEQGIVDAHTEHVLKTGDTITGALIINGALHAGTTGGGFELGRTDGTAGNAFIDFHSSVAVADRNARIIVIGGDATTDSGALTINADTAQINAPSGVSIGAAGNRMLVAIGFTRTQPRITAQGSPPGGAQNYDLWLCTLHDQMLHFAAGAWREHGGGTHAGH